MALGLELAELETKQPRSWDPSTCYFSLVTRPLSPVTYPPARQPILDWLEYNGRISFTL